LTPLPRRGPRQEAPNHQSEKGKRKEKSQTFLTEERYEGGAASPARLVTNEPLGRKDADEDNNPKRTIGRGLAAACGRKPEKKKERVTDGKKSDYLKRKKKKLGF